MKFYMVLMGKSVILRSVKMFCSSLFNKRWRDNEILNEFKLVQ